MTQQTQIATTSNKPSRAAASVCDAANPPSELLQEIAHRRVCCACHEAHDLLLNPPSRTRTLLWRHRWLVLALLLLFLFVLFLYDFSSFCIRHLAFLRLNNMDYISFNEMFRRYLAFH